MDERKADPNSRNGDTAMARRSARSSPWLGWVPLALLPLCAMALRSRLPPWAFMGILAYAIYFGFKWLTWWRAITRGAESGPGRSMAYLLAWPGMDAQTFLTGKSTPPAPKAAAWCSAIGKTIFGVVVFWGFPGYVAPHQTLLAGWIGLVGLSFLSFFGPFHLLALLWQQAGVEARPIMQKPLHAQSLSEFWGARWNLAFRQLSGEFIFRPSVRRLGVGGAIMSTFLASGLLHELVISLPAGAGFGLPTGYFTIQGLGLIIERSALGRQWGLRNGLPGRLYTLLLTAGPAFWLFHPPFILRVVIPFMHAVGAL